MGVGVIVVGAVSIALAVVGWRRPRAGGLVLLFPVAFPIGALLAFEPFDLALFAVFLVIPAASGLAFLAAGLVAHRANRPTSPHPPLTLGPA